MGGRNRRTFRSFESASTRCAPKCDTDRGCALGKESIKAENPPTTTTGSDEYNSRREERTATPHPSRLRQSSPTKSPAAVESPDPSVRKKSYYFDDPTDTEAARSGEADDSIERDLEFLHQRGEAEKEKTDHVAGKQAKAGRRPTTRNVKEDMASQRRRLCARADTSGTPRESLTGSIQRSKSTRSKKLKRQDASSSSHANRPKEKTSSRKKRRGISPSSESGEDIEPERSITSGETSSLVPSRSGKKRRHSR